MLRRIPFITIPLTAGAAVVAAILILQVLRAGGLPDPTGRGDFGARVLDIAVLVFREGLESILVLSAITANMIFSSRASAGPRAAGRRRVAHLISNQRQKRPPMPRHRRAVERRAREDPFHAQAPDAPDNAIVWA